MHMTLADLLFQSNDVQPIEYWRQIYPARSLPAGAEVTRLCPSPTGFLHLGALYMGVINRRIASDTNGVFFLRIEDTDTEREVEGARALIVEGLKKFGITFDEGFLDGDNQFGNYGPYLQTERADIYASFVRHLVTIGRAYPCFMTKEELEAQRAEQEAAKVRPGYYGQYAKWRDASLESVQEKLESGASYVIRFKSIGDQSIKRPFIDEFMGDMQVPQNDEDFVLLKANGIPTYHLAHIVDDYLMGTTFVIRANEWLASVGKHLELWDAFGLSVPKYGHVTPINKKEGSTVRKLSKRKDPEADIMQYIASGYPTDALIGYLYRLANPSFDDWWQETKRDSVWDFPFNIKELKGGRGPLIDLDKLNSISADIIGMMSAADIASAMTAWAETHAPEFAAIVSKDRAYLERILNIERDLENPRKDIVNWTVGRDIVGYFFDEIFDAAQASSAIQEAGLASVYGEIRDALVAKLSLDEFYTADSVDSWLLNIKEAAAELGFATDKQALKENPSAFKGDFGTFMKLIRLALTGRNFTPNLFYVLSVMGRDRVIDRVTSILA
jgi:glutamyl-tRNA synthetase